MITRARLVKGSRRFVAIQRGLELAIEDLHGNRTGETRHIGPQGWYGAAPEECATWIESLGYTIEELKNSN